MTASALVVVLAISAGCGAVSTQSNALGNDSVAPTTASGESSSAAITKSPVFNKGVMQIQSGVEPQPTLPSVTREEAEKQNGINVKLPKITFGGVLKGIYVAPSASGNPNTTVIYSSGFAIDEQMLKEKPDYRAQIADQAATKKSASVYIGADYHVVSVAGSEGKVSPGYSFVGLDNKEYKMPPQLYWWDNGVQYLISCWKLGFSEQQLLEVAESIYK